MFLFFVDTSEVETHKILFICRTQQQDLEKSTASFLVSYPTKSTPVLVSGVRFHGKGKV